LRLKNTLIALTTFAFLLSSCTNQPSLVKDTSYSRTQNGALLGAVAGAVIGATTSKKDKFKDALIGAAAGAAVGGGVGYLLDKQANEIAEALGTGVNNDPLAAVDPNREIVVSKTDRYVKIMFRDSMMFPFNSDQLRPTAKRKVAKVAELLRRYPQTIVQVAGFTDSTGSYDYNYKLSLRRAQSVANVIKSYGAKNRIYVKGCSYNKPLVPNKTEQQKALNRRVEIFLYNNPAHAVDPCRE
jgi:outer membrane protein OmpA-like peptidoglycan-associated protein